MNMLALVEDYVKASVLRPDTIRNYRATARMLSMHLGGDRPITDIGQKDLQAVRDDILSRTSAQTYNHYRRHLSALFRYAVRREYLVRSPLEHVRGAPVARGSRKTVDREVLERAIARLDDKFDWLDMGPSWFWIVVLRTLWFTGMRRRQLVALRWKDIDFDELMLHFRVEGSKTRREWNIPMSTKIEPELLRLKRETEAALDGPVVPSSQAFRWPLFATPRRRLRHIDMTEWQMDRFFQRLSAALEAPISAHRIRHTIATDLANKTHNLGLVQELLGHTDIRTTMSYIHPDLGQMRRMIETLE